ncbi:hypothetical protein Msil_1963 [Methylocella silvestris BL2]|uniref:Haemolysin-type calcium binding-related domain-containing protein n=1 Tax=Methylocella silvestris (strain DSM 15510 / CIP 108128 / LMG 27833 / NCIMB 13906 / BL2) TaxID=395965 RepID=B8EPQ2_METSB|nr:calcium-binding protein [Methylocella silvestris]ACK50906.1 hypothetical protein Msil_1963 [Methylocella silvestris BL2]
MSGITFIVEGATGLDEQDVKNSFENLRNASGDFDQDILYIASKTRVLIIIANDTVSGTSATYPVTSGDTAYYGTYDYVIRIPKQGFDGDTYNHVGTDKWSLERLYAHEVAHVMQAIGDNAPSTQAEREEQATKYSNHIMSTAHPEESPQTHYYNTEGDTGSGLNQNSGSGDSPHILDDSSPLSENLPGAPLPSQLAAIQPAFGDAINASSPLVIDLSSGHSGVTLTTWSASTTETYFDLDDNGFAVQTAWVSGDTGLLARDLNENGIIDSSAELFGSPTVDGFAKLAMLDSNHDLRIDSNDDAWDSLVVWNDDGDAVTQSGELHSLASLNIANIDLAGVASSTSTISGNSISHVSKITFTSGATAAIDDAWFVHDNTNSFYTGEYTLDVDTLFLPRVRGYGTLPDLTIAMSLDSDLKDLVLGFAGTDLSEFADAKTAITDILYKWAGVEGVDPDSRGIWVDAQHLAFLEQFIGSDFLQITTHSADPQPWAGALIEDAYQAAFAMLSADILVQTGFGQLFDTAITYNPSSGTRTGDTDLSEDAIDDLVSIAPSSGPENEAFWVSVAWALDVTKGISNLSYDETTWLSDAITASNALSDWATVLHSYDPSAGTASQNGTNGAETLYGDVTADTIHGFNGADTIYGDYGNDILYGDDGNDVIYGDEGADVLYGGAGNDHLYGGDGNDTIHGEYGNDTLDGGAGGNFLSALTGDDTFVYGGGHDVISDTGGSDQLLLPSGIVLGDLTFQRVSTEGSLSYFDDLLINIDGAGTIEIKAHFQSSSFRIETLVFSDTSTLDLTTLANPDVYLTAGNDTFTSGATGAFAIYGGDGDDYMSDYQNAAHTFDGGNGNDAMYGGAGNDTYIASTGFDTISENAGTDTIVVPAAFTIDDVTFYRILNGSGPTDNLGISINGLGEIAVIAQFSSALVEYMHFDNDNSTISLSGLSITTVGTAGNDNLSPPSTHAGANDILDGREGDDYVNGGSGDDTYIFSAGHDTITESSGDDTILVRSSYAPGDISISFVPYYYDTTGMRLEDTDGNSITVYRQGYSSGYVVEHVAFADTTVWNLSSMEIETHGTSSADYLYGHDVGDASSADTIYGYAGNDTIDAGDGNDLVYAGDGADYVYASNGNDTVYGGNDADELHGKFHSVLYGEAGNDDLYANPYSNEAAGTLVTLFGGDGADTLHGGNYGETVMHGGNGVDTMISAYGTDTFAFDAASAFNAVDVIQQFNTSEHDKIDISDVLDGHYDPLTDAITDFVQITTSGSNSELFVDTTGSATFGSSQHIATIQYITGLTDEAALVTAGTLIAA